MRPSQLIAFLFRAALLLSPATIAVLTFIYLVQTAEQRDFPPNVDRIHTATIR